MLLKTLNNRMAFTANILSFPKPQASDKKKFISLFKSFLGAPIFLRKGSVGTAFENPSITSLILRWSGGLANPLKKPLNGLTRPLKRHIRPSLSQEQCAYISLSFSLKKGLNKKDSHPLTPLKR